MLETKIRALEEASSQHTVEEEPAQRKRTSADSEENKQEDSNSKKPRLESTKSGPSSQVGQASSTKRKNLEKVDEQEGSQKKLKGLNEHKKSSRQGISTPFSKNLPFHENLKLRDSDFLPINDMDLQLIIKTGIKTVADKFSLLNRPAYPDEYDLVRFASRVYKEEKRNEKLPELPKGWVLLTTASGRDSYFGAAYWNSDHQQIVIAHRGTVPSKPETLWTDLRGIVHNNYVAQMSSAVTFASKIIIVLNELNKKPNVNLKLSFTGHSLGGWLAQITAFTTKYLAPTTKNGKSFFNKNTQQTGYHAHTVVFDSPGCKDMLLQMGSDFDVRGYHSSLSISSLDITNYLSAPNLFNTCSSHLGTKYRVFVASLPPGRSSWDLINYTLSTHKIEKIEEVLDPNDNNNSKTKEVIDWPLVKKGIAKRTFEKLLLRPVRKVVFKLLKFGKPEPLPETNEYEYFHKLAQTVKHYNPEPDDEEGYCTIRYQVRDVDKVKCSINIFTQPEFDFLYAYEKLRGFLDAPFANPHTLFSSITEEDVKQKVIGILENFNIEKEEGKNIIRCKSEQELQSLINYVKNMLYLFPDIQEKVGGALEHYSIRKEIYEKSSSDYLESVNKDLVLKEGKINLNDFLKHPDLQVSQQVFQIDTSVVVNAVNEVLKNEENHIVLNLEEFLNLERFFKLVEFLKQIKSNYLLVIEYEHSGDFDVNKKFFEGLLSTLKDKPNIKLILITKEGTKLSNFLKKSVKGSLVTSMKLKIIQKSNLMI